MIPAAHTSPSQLAADLAHVLAGLEQLEADASVAGNTVLSGKLREALTVLTNVTDTAPASPLNPAVEPVLALDLACPTCRADAGRRCYRTHADRTPVAFHQARQARAHVLTEDRARQLTSCRSDIETLES